MRKTTKFLTLVLAVLMMVSTFAMSTSAAFTDVDVDNLALADAVELLSTLGVAKGTSDTTFSPDAEVNRQQMAAFIYRLMKAGKSVEGGANNSGFVDLADATFYYMISWAAQQNIIKGTSATTFNPTGNITLQDAYVMLVRALGYEKDEALPYPFGYIDVAEDLGLDEDLPSDLSYTDNLTRGNVAIILANAFYAEMNEKTTEWAKIPGSVDQWYEKEVPATVCGKIFNVEKETLVVTATANYKFGGSAYTMGANDDEDQVYGVRYNAKDEVVEAARDYTLEELGLEGKSDDYFLANITLFVKKGTEVADDEIIAAQSSLVKKTVKADDVVIARSTKTEKEYYVNSDKKAAKVMTGLVEFGGTKTYFGNTAPASVTKDGEYNDVEFIDLVGGGWSEDGAKFAFAIDTDIDVADYDKEDPDALTNSFAAELPVVYYGGLYAADVYDVDGNGYADYIFVKEYNEILEIKEATKKAHVFKASDVEDGEIYAEEATVVGEFEYGDKLLVYVNTDADYVEIGATLEVTEAKITGKNETATSKKITLSTGDAIEFVNMDKKSVLAADEDIDDYVPGQTIEAYIYNGVILDSATAGATEFDADANYAIILPAFGGDVDGVVYKALTGVKDGELQEALYVKAIIGGAEKTVKLADSIVTTKAFEGATLVDNGKGKAASLKVTDEAKMEAVLEAEFAGKIVTYTATDAGVYTFKTLELDAIADADFADTEEAGAYVYYATGDHDIANFNKNTYTIDNMKNGDDVLFNRFTVTKDSIIVIETVNEKTGDPEYTEYTVDTLPKFTATTFEDVKAIFVNNTSSSVEYLGYLYAKIDEFEAKTTAEYRVITASESKYDEELEEAVTVVTVLDPAAGTLTPGVELAEDDMDVTAGTVVVLKEDGTVKDGTISNKYVDGKLFAANYVAFEEDTAELLVTTAESADEDLYFMINEDTVVLIYVDGEVVEAEADALEEVGEDNAYEELQEAEALYLWMVAEDIEGEDANEDIKNVNYVIISDSATALK